MMKPKPRPKPGCPVESPSDQVVPALAAGKASLPPVGSPPPSCWLSLILTQLYGMVQALIMGALGAGVHADSLGPESKNSLKAGPLVSSHLAKKRSLMSRGGSAGHQ